MKIRSASAASTRNFAAAFGGMLEVGDLVVLAGDLGTGKTTFAQGLARGLGVTEPVTSPTFTIVQQYEGRVPVAHVDVYRLARFQELHDLGVEELFESGVTLIEWGDMVEPALPAERLVVELALGLDDDERMIEISTHGPRWSERSAALTELVARFEFGDSA